MKSNKRILIALHRFAVGGAETQALYLAEHLKENGYEVIVGAFGSEEGFGLQRFKRAGIDTIHWGFQEKLILYPEKGLIGKVRKYRFLIKLISKIRGLKIDTIVPFTYPPNMIFCQWFEKMNVRQCFWNQRDLGIGFNSSGSETFALEKSSKVISNSRAGIVFLNRFTTKEIILIHNGIKSSEPLVNHDRESKKIRVVMVANIHSNKDHLTLLKAWKSIIKKIGTEKAELILAGRKADTFPNLLEFVEKNELEKTIEFSGEVDDVSSLLATCHIGILSSRKEGLPNVVLEYMASGLPIVASDIPGNREVLGENYFFLTNPDSSENFSDRIIDLIDDPELRFKIGKRNQIRVKTEFSIDKMAEAYLSLI